jgi:hypothetical protein
MENDIGEPDFFLDTVGIGCFALVMAVPFIVFSPILVPLFVVGLIARGVHAALQSAKGGGDV